MNLCWIIEKIDTPPDKNFYWSNGNRWGDLSSATIFSTHEKGQTNLPISGVWKLLNGIDASLEARYLKHGGSKCVFCLSRDIEAGAYNADGVDIVCTVTCNYCESQWQDNYKLVSVIDYP